jgi:hypothetical protein
VARQEAWNIIAFNADSATIEIQGILAHTGYAKGKLVHALKVGIRHPVMLHRKMDGVRKQLKSWKALSI